MTKTDLGGALPKIPSLFGRKRVEKDSLSAIFPPVTHPHMATIIPYFAAVECPKSLIKSEYFTYAASPPTAKHDHSTENKITWV